MDEGGRGGKNLHVCVSPAMIMGVWLIAVVLWQLIEQYYYRGLPIAYICGVVAEQVQ